MVFYLEPYPQISEGVGGRRCYAEGVAVCEDDVCATYVSTYSIIPFNSIMMANAEHLCCSCEAKEVLSRFLTGRSLARHSIARERLRRAPTLRPHPIRLITRGMLLEFCFDLHIYWWKSHREWHSGDIEDVPYRTSKMA